MNAKPFVKWAGGKGGIIKTLDALLPPDFSETKDWTYIEPFVGGGAMLFHLLTNYKNIRRVVINDINPDLIHCYRLIKTNPTVLINRLKKLEETYYCDDITDRDNVYYAYRDQFNEESTNTDERAALFIFLNHTCFNGLYRVNSSGKFNVPTGRYKHPVICNEDLIMRDHKLLKSVKLVILDAGDYKRISTRISTKHPNFIYFDPPYRPITETSNNFKDYSVSPFGDAQQEELKLFCDEMNKKGCKFMLSNSDSKDNAGESYFENLYQGYNFQRISAPRYINAFVEKRLRLNEIVIRNYGT